MRGGSGGRSMACSCGIFSNPCKVQPSSPLSSTAMSSSSQSHLVASRRSPASSPLHTSFLPPKPRNFSTQRVGKRVTSLSVSDITAQGKKHATSRFCSLYVSRLSFYFCYCFSSLETSISMYISMYILGVSECEPQRRESPTRFVRVGIRNPLLQSRL